MSGGGVTVILRQVVMIYDLSFSFLRFCRIWMVWLLRCVCFGDGYCLQGPGDISIGLRRRNMVGIGMLYVC